MTTYLDFLWRRPTNPSLASLHVWQFPGAGSLQPAFLLSSTVTAGPCVLSPFHLAPWQCSRVQSPIKLPWSFKEASWLKAVKQRICTSGDTSWAAPVSVDKEGLGRGRVLYYVYQGDFSVFSFHWEPRAESMAPVSFIKSLTPPLLSYLCPGLSPWLVYRLHKAKQNVHHITFQQGPMKLDPRLGITVGSTDYGS